MTKAQEITLLGNFVAGLPTDSYLRPWLEHVMPEVQMEISSDLMVSPSIADTRKTCDSMIAEAKQEQARILADAAKEVEKANKNTRRVLDNAFSALHAANRELQKV